MGHCQLRQYVGGHSPVCARARPRTGPAAASTTDLTRARLRRKLRDDGQTNGTAFRLIGWLEMKKYYAVEVVRQIAETVEVIVHASTEDDAHDAALAHLKRNGNEYTWQNAKKTFTVGRNREIDTPPIVDVIA